MIFTKGRQHSGYLKLRLISFWFFDLYLLKYPEGSSIPPHRDPAPGKRHYRLNWEIRKADVGGQFITEGFVWRWNRLALFRSDICTHEVTKIEHGSRWVLSLGWVK